MLWITQFEEVASRIYKELPRLNQPECLKELYEARADAMRAAHAMGELDLFAPILAGMVDALRNCCLYGEDGITRDGPGKRAAGSFIDLHKKLLLLLCLESANGKPPGGVANRGRRKGSVTTEPGEDRRIMEKWQTGQYETYAALGTVLGKTGPQVEAALDRHRKRSARK